MYGQKRDGGAAAEFKGHAEILQPTVQELAGKFMLQHTQRTLSPPSSSHEISFGDGSSKALLDIEATLDDQIN